MEYHIPDDIVAISTQTAVQASITGGDLTNRVGRGLRLTVTVASLIGVPTYTPVLQVKDASGNYVTLWTAAAALAANGTTSYVFYPAVTTATGDTEKIDTVIGRTFRINITAGGTLNSTNNASVTANTSLIL